MVLVKLLSLNDLEDRFLEEGLNIVPRKKISSIEDIKNFFDNNTPPFVIKGFSRKYSHKTEHGLIYLNVYSLEDLINKYKEIITKAEEVYIEKEVKGREFYISFKKDHLYGNVVSFGKGGIDIELEKDVAFRLLPLNKEGIKDLILSTKYGFFLAKNKFRDIKYDIDKLADVILKLYKIYKEENLLEMEINPIIISSQKYWIVDVRALKEITQ